VARVGVRIGSGFSEHGDPRIAAIEAGTDARAALGGRHADLVLVFFSGSHVSSCEAVLEGAGEALAPAVLAGCGAGGVLGAGRECEHGSGVAVWAATLGGGRARAFHAAPMSTPDGVTVTGLPAVAGASAVVLLADPYSFPVDRALVALGRTAPRTPVMGGIASARSQDGQGALLLGDRRVGEGAVGIVLEGVEVLPCVSQGAAPIGPELTVTAVEGNVVRELAGRPALDVLREAIEGLDPRERALIGGGLLLGTVIDGSGPDYGHGDFLVRGIVGVDPQAGTIAVGADVRPGQVVRLHARDRDSADRDLRQGLALRNAALGGSAAGALLFTCNGRGASLFGEEGHDVHAVEDELGGAPVAGFFAAGEIGPVGGENFVHGFTATVAVFAA